VWHPKLAVQSVVMNINAVNGRTLSSSTPFFRRSPEGRVVLQQVVVDALKEFSPYSYSVDVESPGIKGTDCRGMHVEPHFFEGVTQ